MPADVYGLAVLIVAVSVGLYIVGERSRRNGNAPLTIELRVRDLESRVTHLEEARTQDEIDNLRRAVEDARRTAQPGAGQQFHITGNVETTRDANLGNTYNPPKGEK